MSSVQQLRYLAERARGASVLTASAKSGFPIGEAHFLEKDLAAKKSPAAGQAAEMKEPIMGRPKKQQEEPQDSTEVRQPDFAKAVRIYRQDIKPAIETAGEHAQEASTGYKAIKKECRVNTRAARFVFSLERESEEKRNDVLRSLRGMLGAMNIGITDDLVSDAEGEDTAAPIVPTAAAETVELQTLN